MTFFPLRLVFVRATIPSIFSADFWHGATQPLCKPIECKYASFIVVFRQNMVRVELLLLCFNSYAFLLSRLSSFLSPLMSLKSVLSKNCRNFKEIFFLLNEYHWIFEFHKISRKFGCSPLCNFFRKFLELSENVPAKYPKFLFGTFSLCYKIIIGPFVAKFL